MEAADASHDGVAGPSLEVVDGAGAGYDGEAQVEGLAVAVAASSERGTCSEGLATGPAALDHVRVDVLDDTHGNPAGRHAARSLSSRMKSTRMSLYDALVRPAASIATRLPPLNATRATAYAVGRVSSYHKKALKVEMAAAAQESHLKLGRMRSSDISVLYRNLHLAVLAPSLAQVAHGVLSPKWALLPNAALLIAVLVVTTLYIRRIVLFPARQLIQVKLQRLAGVIWSINAISLVAVLWTELARSSQPSRRLLACGNTLLAGILYGILGRFNDHYAHHVNSLLVHSREANRRHWRAHWAWICRVIRVAMLSTPVIIVYMVLRCLLCWRYDVILDFLPMTNVITLARIIFTHRTVDPRGLLRDTIAITAIDALLFGAALFETWTTQNAFRTVFVRDFARVFTEFFVFVLHLRDTVLVITVCGHILCWFADEQHFLSGDGGASVKHLGAVQMHFGFQLSLLVWLFVTLFCALPADAEGLQGWVVGCEQSSQHERQQHRRLKYFLFESDVHMKTTFTDLAQLEQINPSHFIMDRQIQAFNLAQLVYACGRRPQPKGESSPPRLPGGLTNESCADRSDESQERQRLQQFVKDGNFTIAAVIENTDTDIHCVVLESPSLIAVAFRGTSSKKNARTDLQAAMTVHLTAKRLDLSTLVSRRQGLSRTQSIDPAQLAVHARSLYHRLCCKRNAPKVHSGFYSAYLSVEKRVLDTIATLHRQEPRPILATGHSLGGALAVLCSFDLVARLELTNVTCTTFGCPRIGNTAFRKRYMLAVPATFAFVNAADVVTKLPPKTPKALSYVNVGHIALVNSLGNLVLQPSVLELAVLHRGLSAKAHSLNAYQLSLLLWCLRAHGGQYSPPLWRPALSFLQAASDNVLELRAYLCAAAES